MSYFNWVRQLDEDKIWRNNPDYFPPKSVSYPNILTLTRGEEIAYRYWHTVISSYNHKANMALLEHFP